MADYGATVEAVRALIRGHRLDETSTPTDADAAGWLVKFTAEVATRLGDLELIADAEHRANVVIRAAGLVELATAAQVLDVKFPDRAGPGEDHYAGVLWARYERGLDELAEDVDAIVAGQPGDPDTAGAGQPVYSFPDPLFRLSEGY